MTGDVSGGVATQTVLMDPRFCSLVSYATGTVGQATPADADVRVVLNSASGRSVPSQTFSGVVTAIAANFGVEIGLTWTPTPFILPGGSDQGRLSWQWVNVDSDSYLLSAMIFLFNIRVREVSPMGPLLWSRGAT